LELLAIITIFYGVIESFFQNTIKSFFAYSSIGHMGYILLGLSTGSVEGVSSAIFYLICIYD
jgi:NADH:ubiquinone oxidoreductase subunit 2 (subunit N)